ncbi:hypothetical protein D5086_029929 [Populus alba]|uniref:Uncharacterized protein n=1 Tax=Populus alba TaxID=43335 RepID=A0ACC4AM36_POPAL
MLKGKAIKIEDPLPEDLITEILSWLPVKALLQFKCVCKSWYAIIISQAFISKHLNNYYDNYDDSDTFFAQYFVTKLGELALYWGDLPQNYKLLCNNKCYICLNGVFYWLGSDYSGGKTYDEAIISFDMATDLIQDMQLPDYDKPARETVLSVYHDSLALLTVHDIKDFLEIWTLKEGCWTKQFTVGTGSYGRISPIAHWKNRDWVYHSILCF